MNDERKHHTPDEKVAILRRHLVDRVPVSSLCDEHHVHPTVFYRWLKQFFENGAAAFGPAPRADKQVEAREQRIAFLEAKLKKKDEVLAGADGRARSAKKKSWGDLKSQWAPHDTRDQVIDFVHRWNERTEIAAQRLVRWLGVTSSKFYDWRARYGRVNEHNRWIPRDFWLEAWEKAAILDFHDRNPLEGYRRLSFMMLDAGVVAVSPASVWRVLHAAQRLGRWNRKASPKGKGFQQPLGPHAHWHVDISYVNLAGTFYYLCSVLDGYSRYLVHWEIRASMTEAEVEIILQRARERFPQARPRIISDNGRSSWPATSRSSSVFAA